MSLRVFHEGEPLAPSSTITLEEAEAHYLLRVRRARVGQALEVLAASGDRWRATLDDVDGDRARVRIDERVAEPSISCAVTLLLGLPEPAAALDAIAAACAGGAESIVLIQAERSQRATPGAERMRRVLRSTMRQCGRARPPTISEPLTLEEALARAPELPGLVARPGSAVAPLPSAPARRLLIGPEGGLSPEEETRIDAAGFRPIGLGPWTLRTPAAVTAGLARILG